MTVGKIGMAPAVLLDDLFGALLQDLEEIAARMAAGDQRGQEELLQSAHEVVDELVETLYHPAAPKLCTNLSDLYLFIRDRLNEAHLRSGAIDEARRIAAILREGFQVATERYGGYCLNTFVVGVRPRPERALAMLAEGGAAHALPC